MKCRFCNTELKNQFIDLGEAPPSNAYLSEKQLNEPEAFYPLKVFVCDRCWLVQIDEFKRHDEMFSNDYAYFSSFSTSWLEHCESYVQMITERLALDSDSKIIEIASNDGYLLQYFAQRKIPCLGVEPTAGTAEAARLRGVETIESFFGRRFAERLVDDQGGADLLLGNNVLAHVPDINDFVEGLRIALKETGTITMEFPHLLNLIRYNQFDTVYHEHFSYLSLGVVERIFSAHGLVVYDVEELPTHGGSIRVYARHELNDLLPAKSSVGRMRKYEEEFGLLDIKLYETFQQKADKVKNDFLRFLLDEQKAGKSVVAYGAAAKGNTLLNYSGIKNNDLIEFAVDKSPHKLGLYLPGSHIPVVDESRLRAAQPDIVLILPWNLRDEIAAQLSYIKDWGGQFVVAVPELELFQ